MAAVARLRPAQGFEHVAAGEEEMGLFRDSAALLSESWEVAGPSVQRSRSSGGRACFFGHHATSATSIKLGAVVFDCLNFNFGVLEMFGFVSPEGPGLCLYNRNQIA